MKQVKEVNQFSLLYAHAHARAYAYGAGTRKLVHFLHLVHRWWLDLGKNKENTA